MILQNTTALEVAIETATTYAVSNGCKVLFYIVKNGCHQVLRSEYYLAGNSLLKSFDGEPDYILDGAATTAFRKYVNFDLIGYQDWLNTYRPIQDHTGEPLIFNPRSEKEWTHVSDTDPSLVWTLCEEDGGGWYYLAGFHRNNAVYHHICEVPWTKLVLVVEDDNEEGVQDV